MRLRVLAVTSLVLGLAACGGGGGSVAGGSAEEFCAELERLEAMPETDDITAGLRAFAELRDTAPNGEIRDALDTLTQLIESLGEFDENDPDAFGAVFGLFADSEVMEAVESLETFGREECGIVPAVDPGFTDADDDEDFSGNDGASIFDDVSAGDLSDMVAAHLEAEGSTRMVSSSALSGAGDHTLVEVTLAGEGDVDAIGLCLAVDSWLRMQSEDDRIALSIRDEASGEALAGYELGGFCS
jgi:hypothetical protein